MSYNPETLRFSTVRSSWTSTSDATVTWLKYSIIAGIIAFSISFVFCRSRKSSWDIIAARKLTRIIRFFVICELVCVGILLGQYILYGQPIDTHAALSFGNGESWIFGFPRPVAGIITIFFGVFGDIHPAPRIICLLGCVGEAIGDSMSAYQLQSQINQVRDFNAPKNGYSLQSLEFYYHREFVSLGLCTALIFLVCYQIVMLGCISPQLIHPSHISGNDYDRLSVMLINRDKRKSMEKWGLIETPPPPIVPRKALKESIANEFNLTNNPDNSVDIHEKGLDVQFNDDYFVHKKFQGNDMHDSKPIF